MSNILGTSFAQSGFSFDPNLSPNNAAFAAAVRAVMGQGGYPIPGSSGTATVLGTAAFANPSVSAALTATNGTSTLAMRSDAAPSLSQAISPSWTGSHNFTGGMVIGTGTFLGWGSPTQNTIQMASHAGLALNMAGNTEPIMQLAAGAYFNGTNYLNVGTGTAHTGTSTSVILQFGQGAFIVDIGTPGTNGSTVTYAATFRVNGTSAPTVQGWGPTAGAVIDMTPDIGSFNGTGTGFTTSPTSACVWSKQGNNVILVVGSISGSSNSASFNIGQLPAEITPSRTQYCYVPFELAENNSASVGTVSVQVNTNGSLVFVLNNGANFTNSGTKGIQAAFAIAYLLN